MPDPDLALIRVNLDILDSPNITPQSLDKFKDAIIFSALLLEGYSGTSWRGGKVLIENAEMFGHDGKLFFDTFGWAALANGLKASIKGNNLLKWFSYADLSFVPNSYIATLFEHPLIKRSILETIDDCKNLVIKPGEIGATSPEIQEQFANFLALLFTLDTKNTFLLQWSASALRVFPAQASYYRVVACVLLDILCNQQRISVAYFSFRALAEQHEELWDTPTTLRIFQRYITLYKEDTEVLTHLFQDEEIIRRSGLDLNLMTIIGIAAISIAHKQNAKEFEDIGWLLINELYELGPILSHSLSTYLIEGTLPPTIAPKAQIVKPIEDDLNHLINVANSELRSRQYSGVPLAIQIYQSNVQNIFNPLMYTLQNGNLSSDILEMIDRVDPVAIIIDSHLQKSSLYPIEGRLLSKMISHNKSIIQSIKHVAMKQLELDKVQFARESLLKNYIRLYKEFKSLIEILDEVAVQSIKDLMPQYWNRIQAGIKILEEEIEVA